LALAIAIAVLSAATAPADAQGQYRRGQYTLEPTPLEALAASPDAQTMWSKYVGKLEGGDNYAIVTAVSIQSASRPGRILRGVRIDLRHDGPARDCWLAHVEWTVMCEREQAAAFIDENRLEAFRADVRRGSAEVHPGHPSGITTYRSSYGRGLLLCGYQLPGRTIEEIAAMLDTAAELLKTAPE
jgi:hypothetical protein